MFRAFGRAGCLATYQPCELIGDDCVQQVRPPRCRRSVDAFSQFRLFGLVASVQFDEADLEALTSGS